jgi:heavy metal-binding protein
MATRLFLPALGLALVAGCAAQPGATDIPPNHPANPSAAEAPAPPPSRTLDVSAADVTPNGAPADSHQGGHQHHGAMQPQAGMPTTGTAVVYTCPHHPEVASNEPGKCPKCNMTLVPKPASPPASPDGPTDGGTKDTSHGGHEHGGHP